MKIGYIGLGQMGLAMARNLLRAGHHLKVYNRTRAKAEELAKEGAEVVATAAEAAIGVEAVCSMLADDGAVEEVTFGKGGIAEGLEGSTVHISHSTISLQLARRLEAEHGRRQQVYLSAPVFGRPDVAVAQRLLVVVAGAEEAQARCQPVFDAVGRQTFQVGTEGWRANLFKICGNFMLVSMVETFGEAFAAVRKAGMAPEGFVEVMSELYGSPLFKAYGQLIAAERFVPAGFALRLGLKDTRLTLAVAEELEVPMPIASLVRDHYLSALAHGQADWDWASVALVAAREAGLPVRPDE